MSKYAFGVDVGGTTVKLGLFNDEGQVLDKWEIPTVKDNGGEKVLPDIAASVKNKMQEKNISVEELVGVGIGAPGAVDADGCYWICGNDAGVVHRFTPDGRLDRSIAVPTMAGG